MQRGSKDEQIKRLKEAAVAEVESRRKELTDISLQIHSNPELSFKEFKASKLLSDYLKANGFSLEYGVFGLETAFRAFIGEAEPVIGIIAEYDGLDAIGHGCGHNIIGAAGIGAAVALATIIKELGGRVVVYGSPGEESGTGKALMAQAGAFKDLDAAMMIHPWYSDRIEFGSGVLAIVNVEYFGKTAHPCTPKLGINALDAMLTGFGAFNTYRQTLLQKASTEEGLFGVIFKGADALGLVPDHTTATILAFGKNEDTLKNLLDKVHDCFKAGESATGARLLFNDNWENRVRALCENRTIGQLFDANIMSIRPNWNPVTTTISLLEHAATDMGTVSQMTPSIHPAIAVGTPELGWHTTESAAVCASEQAHKALLDGAKAMAMTAIDLIMRPDVLKKAQDEFKDIQR